LIDDVPPYRLGNPSATEGGKMTAKSRRVLRAPEAAAYTGLSESTLAKRRLYGQPPAFLNLGGRAIGYAIDDLDAWLESCRRQSTSQQSIAQ
jgi:predicted DNA-binding transcriptional regulator AlpA